MATSFQKIGFWTAASIAIGNVVGSGAFALPADLAKYGNLAFLGWIITTIGAASLALIFAGLSSKVSKAGGPYAFTAHAFGDNFGFYVCYGYWIMTWLSNAALAVVATGFISMIYGDFSTEHKFLIEVGILVILMLFNTVGIKIAGAGELVITIFKLIPLIGIPLLALPSIDLNKVDWNILPQSAGDYDSLNAVIFATIWAFIGIESTTVPSNQVEDAKRTIPKAILFGTTVAAFVYILGCFTIINSIPAQQLTSSTAPYALLAQSVFGGTWGIPIAIASLIAVLGTLNGWTLIVGRIPQAAAKDGLFPAIFAKTNAQGTPVFGVVLSSLLTIIFTCITLRDNLLNQFKLITDASVTIILFIYLSSVMAYVKLNLVNRELSFQKGFLVFVATAFCLYAMLAVQLEWLYVTIGLLISGMPIHYFTKTRKSLSR